jgi:hypothetical protein
MPTRPSRWPGAARHGIGEDFDIGNDAALRQSTEQ